MKRFAHLTSGTALLGFLLAAHGADTAPANAPRLRALSDLELRSVAPPAVPTLVRMQTAPARPTWLTRLAPGAPGQAGQGERNFPPLPPLLSAEVTLKEVVYGPNGMFPKLNPDGSMALPLPAAIGELSIQNIRTSPGDAHSVGSILFKGIDLGNTSISVIPGK